MSFTCRPIGPPRQYANPALTARSALQHALDDCTQTGMTGVMYQLAMLSEFSADVFAGLFSAADATNARINAVAKQVTAVTAQLEPLDRHIQQATNVSNVADLNDRARVEHVDEVYGQLFTRASRPIALTEMYSQCDPPPNLSIMDKYAPGCATKFSNPDLFLQQFKAAEERRQAKLKAAKDERKRKRAERRERHRSKRHNQKPSTAKAGLGLDWRAKAGVESQQHAAKSRQSQASAGSSVRVADHATRLGAPRRSIVSAPVPTIDRANRDDDIDYAALASATMSAEQERARLDAARRAQATANATPVQQAPSSFQGPAPPARQPARSARAAPPLAPSRRATPPNPPPARQRTPDAAPIQPPSRGSAPPAPTRRQRLGDVGRGKSLRTMHGGAGGDTGGGGAGAGGDAGAGAASPSRPKGGRLALLADIRKGKTLKTAPKARAKKKKVSMDPRSSLMAAIRSRQGGGLRKVTAQDRKKDEQARKEANADDEHDTMVKALLARRRAFASDSDSGSDSDSDSDSDDSIY